MRGFQGLFIAWILAGCAGGPPPTPEPEAEPVVAADSEAVACAEVGVERSYQAKGEACDLMPIWCEVGYGFRDACGCGCAQESAFAPGHDTQACEADADCGISYMQIGKCCDTLCTADSAYNTKTITLMAAWKAHRCEDTNCPVASCMDGGPSYTAVCEANRCVAKRHWPVLPRFEPIALADASAGAIASQGLDRLAQLADVLRMYPDLAVRLEGHTDPTGAVAAQLAQSRRYAEWARAALIGLGIEATRVEAVAHGGTKPLAKPGARLNRRVEVVLFDPLAP